MRATRWPALIIIPLLLAAMVLVDRSEDGGDADTGDTTVPTDASRAPHPMPVAAPIEAGLSTWYCPVAVGSPDPDAPPPEIPDDTTTDDTTTDDTTTDDTTTDDTTTRDTGPIIDRTVLVLTNVSDDARTGRLELVGPEGSLEVEEISVPGRSRWQLDLARRTEEVPAAALVELDGGGVAATMVASGPHGSTVSSCLSQPAADWYLPTAATTLDARAVLHLFNPFPDDAILEIAFVDREGVRVPTGFEAFPVPAESVVAVELTGLVTIRSQFSTTIHARAGQVVASMVQEYDGSDGPEGLTVMSGAPLPSETWFFPAARWDEQSRETYVIFNPGEVDAQVDLTVALDDPAVNGAVSPFEVTVPSGSFAVVGSRDDDWGRIPPDVGHSVSVRSQNGQPVVAAQRLTVVDDDNPGVAAGLGAPVAALEWIVPVVDLADASGSVSVLNPSPLTLSRVDVTAVAGGVEGPLPRVELTEGGRVVVRPLDDLDLETAGARVVASEPIVVSSAFSFGSGGRAWVLAVPIGGTTVAPDPIVGVDSD